MGIDIVLFLPFLNIFDKLIASVTETIIFSNWIRLVRSSTTLINFWLFWWLLYFFDWALLFDAEIYVFFGDLLSASGMFGICIIELWCCCFLAVLFFILRCVSCGTLFITIFAICDNLLSLLLLWWSIIFLFAIMHILFTFIHILLVFPIYTTPINIPISNLTISAITFLLATNFMLFLPCILLIINIIVMGSKCRERSLMLIFRIMIRHRFGMFGLLACALN